MKFYPTVPPYSSTPTTLSRTICGSEITTTEATKASKTRIITILITITLKIVHCTHSENSGYYNTEENTAIRKYVKQK